MNEVFPLERAAEAYDYLAQDPACAYLPPEWTAGPLP